MNSPNYVNNCNYDGAYNVLTKVSIIVICVTLLLRSRFQTLGSIQNKNPSENSDEYDLRYGQQHAMNPLFNITFFWTGSLTRVSSSTRRTGDTSGSAWTTRDMSLFLRSMLMISSIIHILDCVFSSCKNGSMQCHLHLHLHGCAQTRCIVLAI